jgi:hypothetical protein
MRNNLAVERMTTTQLWDRAFLLVGRLMPLLDQGPKDREVTCHQLEAVLDQIKLRGDQLQLLTAPTPCPPHETT